jgi:hypothetical protein
MLWRGSLTDQCVFAVRSRVLWQRSGKKGGGEEGAEEEVIKSTGWSLPSVAEQAQVGYRNVEHWYYSPG